MSENEIATLNTIIEQSKREQSPESKEQDYFEFFCAEKILREFQIDQDEIESGLVGANVEGESGTDGGIDGFYLFANNTIIRSDDDADNIKKVIKRDVSIDLVLIQATREPKFTLERILRLQNTCLSIFSLNTPPSQFSESYKDSLNDGIARFRYLHTILSTHYPHYNVHIYYASKGEAYNVTAVLAGKTAETQKAIGHLFPSLTKCEFKLLGARELIVLAQKPPKFVYPLTCTDSISSTRSKGYVALVRLSDFYKLLTNEEEELRAGLFESNVRDYQGATSINESIGQSLKESTVEDFWWLNNGITIVVDEVGGGDKHLTLSDPQIVNGLQTSQQIYQHFRLSQKFDDERELLVRVIQAPNVSSNDAIILATNSQTTISKASLWATKPIHRNIEAFFNSHDLFYDRKKNSWRRKGKEFKKVVGITELAQSVGAVVLRQPKDSRSSPHRYFEAKNHRKIFSEKYKMSVFVVCAKLKKLSADYLRRKGLGRADRNNVVFYLMTAVVATFFRSARVGHTRIAELDLTKFNDSTFDVAYEYVNSIYTALGRTDKVAKGSEMMEQLDRLLMTRYSPARKKTRKTRS